MFEDPGVNPQSPKQEPVDIFADVDKVPSAAPAAPTQDIIVTRRGPSGILFAILALLILGGAGFGAYWFFVLRQPPTSNLNTANTAPTPTPIVNQPVNTNTTPDPLVNVNAGANVNAPTEPIQPQEPVQQPPDADADGLSDTEEAALGTNPQATDTDADGLTDREEVQIYMTDPKNPDTDGDSFLDGQEVQGGYDPKGPGRLFGTPQ